jgi:hypothetical protein
VKGTSTTTGLTIEASSARLNLSGQGARVLLGSHLWPRWSRIAVEQEKATRQARREAEDDYAAYHKGEGSGPAEALGRELDAAMQAVSAAGHALDCFYGAVKGYGVVPAETERAWSRGRTKRPNQILETLKLGFGVGKVAQRWNDDLAWLFGLRDGAVHYEEALKEPQLHPIGYHMAPEHVTYSVESVKRAVDLLLGVLDKCFANPKSGDGGLSGYLTMVSDVPPRLRQRRAESIL